jgi:hypothetical protein
VPGAEDAAATVHEAPPPGLGVKVHEFPPEKYVEPLALNTMLPAGIAVDAESLTSAVHAVTLPTARLGGLHVTLVWVGSIAESSARPKGPPHWLAFQGRCPVRRELLRSAADEQRSLPRS